MDLDTPTLSPAPPKSHSTSPSPSPRPFRPTMPYDRPIPSGRCAFAELPEEVLEQVLLRLDFQDLTRCFRLNKAVNEFMTASMPINLRHTLAAASMRLNPVALTLQPGMPHQVPPTSATMLATLRERITRFNNLQPKDTTSLQLAEGEGNLYEYLEGVLLRSVSPPRVRTRNMAVYDLRSMEDWEDVEENENADGEEEKGEGSDGKSKEEASAGSSGATPASTSAQTPALQELAPEDDPAHWPESEDEDDEDDGVQLILIDDDEDDHFEDGDMDTDGDDEWHSVQGTDDDSDADSHDDEDSDHGSIAGAVGVARINDTDPTALGIRREHAFNFNISEMAVDPGQDLLVLVSVRLQTMSPPTYAAYLHLFSLSTFEPHPEAASHILQWPQRLTNHTLSLDFQICDDSLFILMHPRERKPDHLAGWNWRKGKQIMSLTSKDISVTYSSFVLLSPSSFVIPTMRTILNMDREERTFTHADLDFTHHLELYAFPEGELPDEPYEATHVATIDLPHFTFALERGVVPVRMSARTDPPPRQSFPRYPLHAPPAFMPDPTSGIAIFDIYAPDDAFEEPPHYVLFMLKTTLLRYMPAPTSPLLKESWSRPVPVISWDKIAPYCRLMGPDMEQPNWVCYVYQNRFVTVEDKVVGTVLQPGDELGPGLRVRPHLVLYDFDPLRVRKERLARMYRLPAPVLEAAKGDDAAIDAAVQGDVDGIELVLNETELPAELRLRTPVVTGKHLPYIKVSRPIRGPGLTPVPLIDSERILLVREGHRRAGRHGGIEIMQF